MNLDLAKDMAEKYADEKTWVSTGYSLHNAVRELLKRLAIAEKIADVLLEFESKSYIGTPATKDLMTLVRDFKGII